METRRRTGMFLSYASKDAEEVEALDLELRRRGVPLWRDHTDLRRGRRAEKDILEAIESASGFIVYASEHAARSRWVREIELGAAMDKQRRSPNSILFPIFRGSVPDIEAAFATRAEREDADRYAIARLSGHVIGDESFHRDRRKALRSASDAVLASYLDAIRLRRGRGAPLEIGLITRGGPALASRDVDLRIDWTADYPEDRSLTRDVPTRCDYEENLEPALEAVKHSLASELGSRPLRIDPQCHLTMALAFGIRFRRNVHFDLAIVVAGPAGRRETWHAPSMPMPAMPGAWSFADRPGAGRGRGIAAAINVTQPAASFHDDVRRYLESGAGARAILCAEPATGPSKTVLAGLEAEVPHRMAVALVEAIEHHPAYAEADFIHLFFAGPVGLAILLGQALSNVRPVQTYEWLGRDRRYAACFELVGS